MLADRSLAWYRDLSGLPGRPVNNVSDVGNEFFHYKFACSLGELSMNCLTLYCGGTGRIGVFGAVESEAYLFNALTNIRDTLAMALH